jgi:hypothetical protein
MRNYGDTKFATLLKLIRPVARTVTPVYAIRNLEKTSLTGPTHQSDRFAVRES